MQQALSCADKAWAINEVPVGAIIVDSKGKVISEGFNENISLNDPCSHAEIIALKKAGKLLNNYRLNGCIIYVTLEPCMMCLGALIHARIDTVVYGARDMKTGCLGGAVNLNNDEFNWNHKLKIISGVCEHEASTKLKKFFQKLRLDKLEKS